jgi:hypothetical protein
MSAPAGFDAGASAGKYAGASPKQAALIDRLQTLGAPIPCKGDGDGPDFSMLASVAAADAYIKAWVHLLQGAGGRAGKVGSYRPGMAISVKQEQLIARLHGLGAALPQDDEGAPSMAAFASVAQADAFIKEWQHLLWAEGSQVSAADWGGIPNH